MKTFLKISAVLISIAALSSCSTTMYTTNAVNAPLLKEKGEVKINVTQNDLQAAVAVSDHIGIMANGYYQNYKGDNGYKHNGAMGELGLGYFINTENNLVMETFIGAGLGQVHKQEQLQIRLTIPIWQALMLMRQKPLFNLILAIGQSFLMWLSHQNFLL